MDINVFLIYLQWIVYSALLFTTTGSVDCDFDDGFCNWTQDSGDDFDWKRLSGRTETRRTGPNADHTSGVGHYVYIDSSEEAKNKMARLFSPERDPGSYCLSLWVYMFGEDVDKLRVLTKEGKDNPDVKFTMIGNQGKKWILQQIQLDVNKIFKIIVEGRVKNDFNHSRGDIAIDDFVMFSSTECPEDCGDPVPEFGHASPSKISIGSKVQITCKPGYSVVGNYLIVCQANGTWSDSPFCNPINCSDPTPKSGSVNATNFQYGSMVEVTCKRGYRIAGHSLIICQANMTWSDNPVCNQIDCGIKNITNGVFNASLGTTYGKKATQSCETGYTFEGDKTLSCYDSGWNGTFATCSIVDCDRPFVATGMLAETPNGTTYTKMAVLACEDGYAMIGNAIVTCQADGNWTTLPYCITEDSEVSAVIAVYIIVPFMVFVLVIILLVHLWRKRSARNGKGITTEHVTDIHSVNPYQNETYNENANNECGIETHKSRQEADESMSADEDYAIIDHNRKKEASENVYYNTFETDCSEKDLVHHYDHTKKTLKPTIDKNYSHTTGNVTDKAFKPSYCKVNRLDTKDELLQSDAQRESESYDHINIKHQIEDMKQELSIKIDEDESNYDHAKAGGIKPLALELDEYSHLNDANIVKRKNNREEMSTAYECQYSNVSERTDKSNRIDKERKVGYEKPVGHTPHYFVLERNQNECEDVKNNFVLEAEENCDEINASCNHDYFVLEKIESF